MYKYLEIIEDETKKVVSRMDVTDKSERSIDRIVIGAEKNLNHKEYSTRITDSEIELQKIY